MSEVRGLRANWILPIAGPPIRHGIVIVERGQVRRLETQARNLPITNYENAVIIPALVNAHTHLEFSNLRQPLHAHDGTFAGWIEAVIQQRRQAQVAPEDVGSTADPCEQGSREILAGGCAYVGNIATSGPNDVRASCDARLPVSGIEFHEVLGLRQAQADEKCHALLRWLDHPPSSAWLPGISPHAPYTLHQQTFQRVMQIAESRRLPIAMHLAESRDEMELLRTHQGPFRDRFEAWQVWDPTAFAPGTSPRDYLLQLTKTPRALVVHGNYLGTDDLEFLAQRREQMALVHCPRTHEHFQHDRNPLMACRKHGVRVVLGTDSRASNPDLSMFEELRFLVHRYPSNDPSEFLEMATRAGAAALGMLKCGEMAPNRAASFAIVKTSDDARDPYAFLKNENASIQEVIIQGESRWTCPGSVGT